MFTKAEHLFGQQLIERFKKYGRKAISSSSLLFVQMTTEWENFLGYIRKSQHHVQYIENCELQNNWTGDATAAIYPQIPTLPLLHPPFPLSFHLSSPSWPTSPPASIGRGRRGFCPRSITHSIHHLPLQPSLPSQVPTCFWTLKSVNVCLPLPTTFPPVH